jgi:hypothetical protein
LATTNKRIKFYSSTLGISLLSFSAFAQRQAGDVVTNAGVTTYTFNGEPFGFAVGALIFLYAIAALATPRNEHGQSG